MDRKLHSTCSLNRAASHSSSILFTLVATKLKKNQPPSSTITMTVCNTSNAVPIRRSTRLAGKKRAAEDEEPSLVVTKDEEIQQQSEQPASKRRRSKSHCLTFSYSVCCCLSCCCTINHLSNLCCFLSPTSVTQKRTVVASKKRSNTASSSVPTPVVSEVESDERPTKRQRRVTTKPACEANEDDKPTATATQVKSAKASTKNTDKPKVVKRRSVAMKAPKKASPARRSKASSKHQSKTRATQTSTRPRRNRTNKTVAAEQAPQLHRDPAFMRQFKRTLFSSVLCSISLWTVNESKKSFQLPKPPTPPPPPYAQPEARPLFIKGCNLLEMQPGTPLTKGAIEQAHKKVAAKYAKPDKSDSLFTTFGSAAASLSLAATAEGLTTYFEERPGWFFTREFHHYGVACLSTVPYTCTL